MSLAVFNVEEFNVGSVLFDDRITTISEDGTSFGFAAAGGDSRMVLSVVSWDCHDWFLCCVGDALHFIHDANINIRYSFEFALNESDELSDLQPSKWRFSVH